MGVTNRASLDDSGLKLIDCEAAYLKLTQSLNNPMTKSKSNNIPQAGLTKRKSSILDQNPVKLKLAGNDCSKTSNKGFELGNS